MLIWTRSVPGIRIIEQELDRLFYLVTLSHMSHLWISEEKKSPEATISLYFKFASKWAFLSTYCEWQSERIKLTFPFLSLSLSSFLSSFFESFLPLFFCFCFLLGYQLFISAFKNSCLLASFKFILLLHSCPGPTPKPVSIL